MTPGSQGSLRAAAQGLGRGAPESRAWMMALHCWGLQVWLCTKLGAVLAVQRRSEWSWSRGTLASGWSKLVWGK